jgi:thiol-disulfide isomerase/thioredoxin
MNKNKLLAAAVLTAAIGAPIAGFVGEMKGQSMTSTGVRVPFLHGFPISQTGSQTELASLERANEWLNSPPLAPAALRGKVVLVDFWTYTCINWRRTLPYVRAWAEKYKDQGLVVIGVHAPEFAFEKNINNIRWAVKDMRIDPILAGAIFHRRARPPSPSPFRRGRLRAVRNDHPGASSGGRSRS